MRHIGRLLRLSLIASAPADAAAGLVVGCGTWPTGSSTLGGAPLWLLPLASACVFHGGMALNDWADRRHDARTRPDRPIPSGAISPRAALGIGLVLLVAGVLIATRVGAQAGAGFGLLAAAVLAYDLGPRGPLLGPLLLGLCRATNLGTGLLVGGIASTGGASSGSLPPILWTLPIGYGLYVFVVSRLGRLEDGEQAFEGTRATARHLLALSSLLLVPGVVGLVCVLGVDARIATGAVLDTRIAPLASLALGIAAASALVRLARTAPPSRPEEVPPAMGMALRRLLLFTASTAVLPGSPGAWITAGVILAGFPLSHALRRLFPPT